MSYSKPISSTAEKVSSSSPDSGRVTAVTAVDKVQYVFLGSEEVTSLFCQPCELDSKQVSAYGYCKNCEEHLCEECYRTHRRPAPSRGHVLLDSSQMPQSKGPGQSLIETCAVHDGESIKYLCTVHNIFGCDICVKINHRNCKTGNINEISKGFQSSKEYTNMLQKIEQVKNACMTVKKTAKENMQTTQQSRETIRNEIENIRKQINEQINLLFTENDRKHDAENVKAATALFNSRDILQKVEQLQENLTSLQKVGSLTRFFIQARKDESTLNDLKSRIQETKKFLDIVKYTLKKKTHTCEMLNNGIAIIW